jgi:hypothetical protein
MAESSPRPRWYTLDARSLAALRIGLGALVLLDLGLRSTDLLAHYTDLGVLPRALVPAGSWDFAWSLHRLGGSAGFEAALFALHALAAALLLLGWRTFWASLLTAVLTISLHGRNPLLRDGQDDLLRVLLVWGVLLPWGSCWSLDARRGRAWHPLGSPAASSVETPATAGYLLQLLLVYWSSAIAKLESPWWRSGEALSLAMSISRYETSFGQWLLRAPALLHAATFAVLGFELLAPAVVLLRRNARWRIAEVVAFWLLHLGMATVLRLGLFPLIAAVGWVALLPGTVWPREEETLATAPQPGRAPVARALVGVLLALVVLVNATYLWPRPGGVRLGPVQTLARVLGLQQYWSVFSPTAGMTAAEVDGWLSVVGERADHRSVDLLAGGAAPSSLRPRLGADLYPNRRWRHWAAALREEWPRGTLQRRTVEEARVTTMQWWCREWNDTHPVSERVEVVRVGWVRQRLGHPEDPPEPRVLSQGVCKTEAGSSQSPE